MGGASSSEKAQTSIAASQDQISQDQYAQSQAREKQMDTLLQPSIDFNKLLSTGDRGTILSAIAPQLGQINQASAATKENIYDTTTGVARDVALTGANANKNSAIAGAASNAYLGSFDKLANIGSGLGSYSLQELGASLTAGQQAAGNYGQIDQAQTARKGATMGFLGSLAGAGGSALSGTKLWGG